MKKVFALLSVFLLMISCQEQNGPTGDNKVSSITVGVDNITAVSAVLKGKANLGSSVAADLKVGFQYSKSAGILPSNSTTVEATDADAEYNYTSFITGLDPSTTYYYRSFVRQNNIDTYGETKEFTTSDLSVSLATVAPSDITGISAILNAAIILPDGAYDDLYYGFYWGTSEASMDRMIQGMEIKDNKYSSTLTELTPITQVWYKAVVILNGQTFYGDTMTFTTLESFDGEAIKIGSNAGAGSSYSSTCYAGEWDDIANWPFWSQLLAKEGWAAHSDYWHFYPRTFACVETIGEDGTAVCGLKVTLKKDGQEVWSAISDNKGRAILWAGLYDAESLINNNDYSVVVSDVVYNDITFTSLNSQSIAVNRYLVNQTTTENAIDVAFIVDATGSMGDPIAFLKSTVKDIFRTVGKQCTATIRTSTVFYRDQGDDFITKYSQFTTDINETSNFINKQEAANGGDWPEAVEEALSSGRYSLKWNTNAKSRIAFLILDAPPHHEEMAINKCQKYIEAYAAAGIKIIPIAAGGTTMDTEFLIRCFAMATNGTYLFITTPPSPNSRQGVATVGEYQTEKLQDLIVRIIVDSVK